VANSLQFSLLDEVDDLRGIGPGELAGTVQRVELGRVRGAICGRVGCTVPTSCWSILLAHVPWTAERRPMYERVVDVPRLACRYEQGAELPHPAVQQIKDALDAYYLPEFGEPFASAAWRSTATAGTAWPGTGTPSVGQLGGHDGGHRGARPPRPFLMRPRPEHAPPGPTRRHLLGTAT